MINGPKADKSLSEEVGCSRTYGLGVKESSMEKEHSRCTAVEVESHLKTTPWHVHLMTLHHGWTAGWVLHGDVYFLVPRNSTKGVRNMSVILLFPLVIQTSRS